METETAEKYFAQREALLNQLGKVSLKDHVPTGLQIAQGMAEDDELQTIRSSQLLTYPALENLSKAMAQARYFAGRNGRDEAWQDMARLGCNTLFFTLLSEPALQEPLQALGEPAFTEYIGEANHINDDKHRRIEKSKRLKQAYPPFGQTFDALRAASWETAGFIKGNELTEEQHNYASGFQDGSMTPYFAVALASGALPRGS